MRIYSGDRPDNTRSKEKAVFDWIEQNFDRKACKLGYIAKKPSPSPYPIIYTIKFNNKDDAMRFKLAWANS